MYSMCWYNRNIFLFFSLIFYFSYITPHISLLLFVLNFRCLISTHIKKVFFLFFSYFTSHNLHEFIATHISEMYVFLFFSYFTPPTYFTKQLITTHVSQLIVYQNCTAMIKFHTWRQCIRPVLQWYYSLVTLTYYSWSHMTIGMFVCNICVRAPYSDMQKGWYISSEKYDVKILYIPWVIQYRLCDLMM